MIDKIKALAKKHGITSVVAGGCLVIGSQWGSCTLAPALPGDEVAPEAAPASEEEAAPAPETPAEEEADDGPEKE